MDQYRFRPNKKGPTVTFNHVRLDDIVTNEFKVGMTNPMANSGLGTSEKVIENCDIVTEEHETVNEMRANKTCTTGDKDTFTLRRREEFNGRETGKGSVRD